jgi:aminotransferase class I and II
MLAEAGLSEHIRVLATITALHAALCATPGPNMLLVSQTTVSRSRVDGILVACGVAFNVMCVNTLAQRVAEIAVTGDNSELAARKEFYFENMRLAYERMTELGWNVHYPEGSFYLFPKHGIAEPISAQILRDTKVAVIDGQHFGPSGAGHVRISCCVPRPVLTEGIERIVNWFKRRRFAVPPPARPLPQRARSITGEPSGQREIAGVLG